MTDEEDELATLRDAFPGYRFRRRDIRGVPCYQAEAAVLEQHGVPRRPVGRPPRRT